CLQTKDYPYSF
nr:immunoglobulin light chain junction region [Macaca mulatta]